MRAVSSTKKFTLCMVACMIFTAVAVGQNMQTSCGDSKRANTGGHTPSRLQAGAGAAGIVFPNAMFANPSLVEGFNGTYLDYPYARVMVFETDSKVAIVSLELVRTDADGVALVKDIVNHYTGTPKDNIWVHSNHNITTPHEPTVAALKDMWMASLRTAITEAAQEAAASFQPAALEYATGTSDVNVNRNVKMSDGKFHIGLDGTRESNKAMTILRVSSVSGKPIGFLISYGIKPTAIDNAGMAAGIRQISTDVPGMACRMMEQEFGVPTMFLMGGTGDQIPKYDAYRAKDTGNGSVTDNYDFSKDVGMDYIFQQMTNLGVQMGHDAISIAKDVSCKETHPDITHEVATFQWPAITFNAGANEFSSVAGTLLEIQVDAIRLGNSAFIGFKPELDSLTEQQLQAAAHKLGYTHVMLAAFLNGDAKYMPHKEAYTLLTVEAKKTGFAQGAAEELVTTSLKLLNGFMGITLPDTTPPSAISTVAPTTTTTGPVTITVLAYDDISGVASIKTPNGTKVPGATATYTVSVNDTYNFIVTDNAGNTATIPVTVSNIH
jgi:neutral ceramidase